MIALDWIVVDIAGTSVGVQPLPVNVGTSFFSHPILKNQKARCFPMLLKGWEN